WGIFWHQFHDRKNDLEVGLKTAVTSMSATTERRLSYTLTITELLALTAMIWYCGQWIPVLFLIMYLVYVWMLNKKMNPKIITVRPAENQAYHIFLSDYYQVLFP